MTIKFISVDFNVKFYKLIKSINMIKFILILILIIHFYVFM
jgi:hypothetical protein